MARKSTRRAPRKAAPSDPKERIIDAALALAAKRPWGGIALADIAAAARLSLAELHATFPSKLAILEAFLRRTDRAVMAAVAADAPEGSARDRLFDVVMRRFDALAPHRAAIASVLRATLCDPVALLCGGCAFRRSMAAMLEAAGLTADGLAGAVRVKGLGAIYLATLRVWLGDESADRAATMAALDRRLRQAERCLGALARRRAA